MNQSHALLYLASRVLAAVVNVLSLALFTRLATADVFGQYLIAFAISFIVFGGAFQWAIQAHFGLFARANAAKLAGALMALLGLMAAPAAIGLAVCILLGLVSPADALGCAVLTAGMTIHIAAVEIGRAHLMVGRVTVASVTRSLLTLGCGVLALWVFHSAQGLLIGLGVANLLAAAPVLLGLRRTIWQQGFVPPNRSDMIGMVAYGWPLILALGTAALAMNLDRLLLDQLFHARLVGPYGATADFTKQSFTVLGEAIAAAYVSFAKSRHGDGDLRVAQGALREAFVTLSFIVVFGVVFFVLLGRPLLGLVLAPEYQAAAQAVLPILLVGTALLVLRAFYFGQIIYFSGGSRLELFASMAMLAGAGLSGLVLIPIYQTQGAAAAFALGQAAALAVFLAADWRVRSMPVDWPRAGALIGAGLAAIILGLTAQATLGETTGGLLSVALVGLASLAFALRWNLFGARKILNYLRGRVAVSKAR